MIEKAYFAHPLSSYGTPEERLILEELRRVSYIDGVVNPNEPLHQAAAARLRQAALNPKEAGAEAMNYFVGLAATCDACVFLSFPDGKIGAGIVKEADSFFGRGAPVLEILFEEDQMWLAYRSESELSKRGLDVEQTRAYLRALSPAYAEKNQGPSARIKANPAYAIPKKLLGPDDAARPQERGERVPEGGRLALMGGALRRLRRVRDWCFG